MDNSTPIVLTDIMLVLIESAANGTLRGFEGKPFAHPNDTLLLIKEIRRLRGNGIPIDGVNGGDNVNGGNEQDHVSDHIHDPPLPPLPDPATT